MRTWICIGLSTTLVLGVVVALAVLAWDERQVQHRLASEAGDAPYGTVRLAGNITTVAIHGENGTSVCKPESSVIKLPVGEYRADSWIIARTDTTGSRWEMRGMLPPGKRSGFTVAGDKEASLPFGEPIYCTIQVSRKSSGYSFEQRLEGRHGERIELTRSGSRPPPPKLRIRSRDGTYDQSLSFAYG